MGSGVQGDEAVAMNVFRGHESVVAVVQSELENSKEYLTKIQQRDWAGLPYDLLCLMFEYLFIDDVKRFHNVCRAWRSTPTSSVGIRSQWLMCIGNDTKRCKFFNPVYKEPYTMDIPELYGAVPRFSKDGWMLMSRGLYSIFFFNPFTKALINLPDLPLSRCYEFKGITFTSSPTLPDCMVFAIYSFFDEYFSTSTIRHGEESWLVDTIEFNLPIFFSHCNPVFHNQKFYCLDQHGRLGVFDPKKGKWRIHHNPQRLYASADQNFLVECNEELLSVFIGFNGKWISVLKWDNMKNAWGRVDSLGDQMLFVSNTTSFSAKQVIKGMKNKIYLPRIQGNSGVFYSFDSGMYQTFGNGYSRKDLYTAGEPSYCCWIEPTTQTYSSEELNWLANS